MTVPDRAEQDRLAVLQRSGLFEGAWFAARNPDLAAGTHLPLVHWHRYGWREQRWPNPYFDPVYYAARNPDCTGDPLLHYATAGEAAGRRPVLWFDPTWYRQQHAVPADELCLAHFLRLRRTGRVSPVAEFDAAFYLQTNPDVSAAGMDPMEHYLVRGFAEGRPPSPGFNARRWPGARLDPNPLLGLLRWRERVQADSEAPNIASEVRRNTRPHPEFEEVSPLPAGIRPAAKLLAYFLPQFHPVAENDAAWGRGFTEWTNLGRALPRFAGHYQPRIPRDLGFYHLDAGTLRRQVALAKGAGLHGFVFYYYSFNGRRLLDAPLEALLADPALDMPFCLMWANENWTRRWDGSDDQVLVSQDYRPADEPALVAEFARHFADPRYIRLRGRPVLMVYRARLIPDTAATVERWRRLFQAASGDDPLFIMAQSFGDEDPGHHGMDAAVEFPPHKLTSRVPEITDTVHVLDPAFDAEVYDYAAIARASVEEPAPAYPLIKTACRAGTTTRGGRAPGPCCTAPRRRCTRLAGGPDPLRPRHPVEGEAMVCINAWNEWAEGATLEPDVHWGGAFLNATARAVAGLPAPAPAPASCWWATTRCARRADAAAADRPRAARVHGVEVAFLLLGGGLMEAEYRAVAPDTVARDAEQLDALAAGARADGCSAAIVNSAASARAVPPLARHGIAAVLLVHELPRLLRENGLLDRLRQAWRAATTVVFPAESVRDRCCEAHRRDPGRTPSCCRRGSTTAVPAMAPAPRAGGAARAAGAILAVGMGYADLRKGFDLFLQVWRADAATRGRPVYLAWAGGIDPATASLPRRGDRGRGIDRHLPLPRAAHDPAALLAAADVFLLTSREDPLPSAALEAMAAGTPVVAFEDTGGMADAGRGCGAGACVPLGDTAAMARAARLAAAAAFTAARRDALATAAGPPSAWTLIARACWRLRTGPRCCQSRSWCPAATTRATWRRGSPPSSARATRCGEVIVLDDASVDDSVAVAERTAAGLAAATSGSSGVRSAPARCSRSGAGRRRRRRPNGSGSPKPTIDCDPRLLAAPGGRCGRARDPVLAFCDSRAIDGEGATLWPRPQGLLRRNGPGRAQHGRGVRGRRFPPHAS